MNKVVFSSVSSELCTPDDLFDSLDREFHFNLDPCSTHSNAKCKKHFTLKENGLLCDWSGHRVFCNPPYGRNIGEWVKKAFLESLKPGTLVVMLLPVRTDTSYFHDYIQGNSTIRFIRGRLHFFGSKTPAPFPSMIVIFRSSYGHNQVYSSL